MINNYASKISLGCTNVCSLQPKQGLFIRKKREHLMTEWKTEALSDLKKIQFKKNNKKYASLLSLKITSECSADYITLS